MQDFVFGTITPASAEIYPGSVATFSVTINPTAGTTFPAAVALTLTGQPSNVTATLSTTTLASGSAATAVQLVLNVPLNFASNQTPSIGWKAAPFALALLLPLFGIRRMRKSWMRYMMLLIVLLGGLAATAGLSGCGTKPSGYFGQGGTTYDYNVTITGTSGGLSHSTVVHIQIN